MDRLPWPHSTATTTTSSVEQLALEFEPPPSAAPGRVWRVGSFDHGAFVTPRSRRFEAGIDVRRLFVDPFERSDRNAFGGIGEQRGQAFAPAQIWLVQQQLAVNCQKIEGDVRQRYVAQQRGIEPLTAQPRLQMTKRKHAPVAHRHDFAVEDGVAVERRQSLRQLGIRRAYVVERPREERDAAGVHVSLRANAVVLIFQHPGAAGNVWIRRCVWDRRREHEADRRPVRGADFGQVPVLCGQGGGANVSGRHYGSTNVLGLGRECLGDRLQNEAFAKSDPQVAGHDLHDVRDGKRIVARSQNTLEPDCAARVRVLAGDVADLAEDFGKLRRRERLRRQQRWIFWRPGQPPQGRAQVSRGAIGLRQRGVVESPQPASHTDDRAAAE